MHFLQDSSVPTENTSLSDAGCLHRDPLYEKVKSALWDLFPEWEDLHYDQAFKEMLWASEGGERIWLLTFHTSDTM